jgi:hypothetical protein
MPLAVKPLALPVVQEIVPTIENHPSGIIVVRGQRIGRNEHDPGSLSRGPHRVNSKNCFEFT